MTKLRSAVPRFVRDLFTDWIALLSGIASVALTVAGYLSKTAMPPSAFWITGALCFALALFRVWWRECQARDMAERRLATFLADRTRDQAVSQQLASLYEEGRWLRHRIAESGDGSPVEYWRTLMGDWVIRVTNYVKDNISAAKAARLKPADFQPGKVMDMKSEETRPGKEALVLRMGAFLDRLADLMKDH